MNRLKQQGDAFMHTRRAVLVSAALVTALVPVLTQSSAHALQAPVAFTSTALPTYQTNGIAWAVASAQGKVFVGGTFTSVRPAGSAAGSNETARTNFVVLDAATGAPTTCAPAFTVTSSPSSATVRALDVSPDGATLYVGGYFTSAGGMARQFLSALDIATCTIDATFKPLPNATVRAIRSTAATVYYGGDLVSANGSARKYAAAAVAVGRSGAGSLSPWAPALDKNVRALGIKPDGTAVVIGGNFDTVNGATSNRLVVVDSTTGTTNVKSFTGLNARGSVVKSIAVDSTGFYTGNEGTGAGSFDGRLAFNWTSYARRWIDDCQGATQSVIVYNAVLYSGSHAHDCSIQGWFPNGARHHFLAETTQGSKPSILSWFPNTNDGLGESLGPRGLTIAKSGTATYLYAVGEFTSVNGVAQQGITRFGTGPDTSAPTTPVISVQSPSAGHVRIAWTTSLDTDDSLLTYRVYRDTSTTPVYTAAATSWFWNRPQQVFIDSGLANASTHSYTVSVSDGINVRTSPAAIVTVAGSPSDPPAAGAPTGVIVAGGSGVATVNWTAPSYAGTSPISGYRVRRFAASSLTVLSTTTVSAASRSFTATGLTNGTPYSFDVTSINASGLGGVSSRSAVVVPATVPTAPVIGKATGTVSGGHVVAVARWAPPLSNRGRPVMAYRVYAYRVSAIGAVLSTTVSPRLAATYRAWTMRLPIVSRYRFAVRAINSVGYSAYSARSNLLVPARVPGAPSIGTAVSGLAGGAITATARWTAPRSNGGAVITAYRVYAYRISRTGTILAITWSPLIRSALRAYTLRLPAAGSYRFAVRAVNAMGYSRYSSRSNLASGR